MQCALVNATFEIWTVYVCVCVRTFLLKGQFNIKSQQICVDARDNPTRHLANNDDDDVLKYAHRIA